MEARKNSNKNNIESSNNIKTETQHKFIYFLLTNYSDIFQKFLGKILIKIFNGEITSMSDMSNSLFALTILNEAFYYNCLNQIIEQKFKNHTSQLA